MPENKPNLYQKLLYLGLVGIFGVILFWIVIVFLCIFASIFLSGTDILDYIKKTSTAQSYFISAITLFIIANVSLYIAEIITDKFLPLIISFFNQRRVIAFFTISLVSTLTIYYFAFSYFIFWLDRFML